MSIFGKSIEQIIKKINCKHIKKQLDNNYSQDGFHNNRTCTTFILISLWKCNIRNVSYFEKSDKLERLIPTDCFKKKERLENIFFFCHQNIVMVFLLMNVFIENIFDNYSFLNFRTSELICTSQKNILKLCSPL